MSSVPKFVSTQLTEQADAVVRAEADGLVQSRQRTVMEKKARLLDQVRHTDSEPAHGPGVPSTPTYVTASKAVTDLCKLLERIGRSLLAEELGALLSQSRAAAADATRALDSGSNGAALDAASRALAAIHREVAASLDARGTGEASARVGLQAAGADTVGAIQAALDWLDQDERASREHALVQARADYIARALVEACDQQGYVVTQAPQAADLGQGRVGRVFTMQREGYGPLAVLVDETGSARYVAGEGFPMREELDAEGAVAATCDEAEATIRALHAQAEAASGVVMNEFVWAGMPRQRARRRTGQGAVRRSNRAGEGA